MLNALKVIARSPVRIMIKKGLASLKAQKCLMKLDQMSHYSVMTEEAINEVRNILGSPDYYLNLDKTMAFSMSTAPIDLAMSYLTGK